MIDVCLIFDDELNQMGCSFIILYSILRHVFGLLAQSWFPVFLLGVSSKRHPTLSKVSSCDLSSLRDPYIKVGEIVRTE